MLCPSARHFILVSIMLVQPKKTRPDMTEKLLTGTYRIITNNQTYHKALPEYIDVKAYKGIVFLNYYMSYMTVYGIVNDCFQQFDWAQSFCGIFPV